ncbi:anthrone oxygenase family protein [Pseudaminobacter sp. NGMCC 1.201702]|uniref:anthrone oxygenase family protein n=1 Tax=Pseudaminobacter sp. NGMCC 1.201702 TaxID=3391825 RepID=UPI0039F13AB7
MSTALQTLNLLLVALFMVTTLAHALEMPGKMRLSKDIYFAAQRIYYPGFTIAGIAEPVAMLTLLAQAYLLQETPVFWPSLAALFALIVAHAIYWVVTHPVNKFWLEEANLSRAGQTFFETASPATGDGIDWQQMRSRWEYSHVARAVLAVFAFLILALTRVP